MAEKRLPVIIGADPGLGGAIVRFDPETNDFKIFDMPTCTSTKGKNEIDIMGLADLMQPDHEGRRTIAAIELVGPRGDVNGSKQKNGIAATWTFAYGFGILRAVAAMQRLEVHLIVPTEWQKLHRIDLPASTTYKERKSASRALASQLFPRHAESFKRVCDDGRAEACLIATAVWKQVKN